MDQKAIKLCARFALTPNQLGYCGTEEAPNKLQKCILKGECNGVEEELEKFIILNPYLQTIAQITDLDPFSYEVIEAYWFGNELLKKCKPEHYNLLLTNFEKQGVPKFLVKELKTKKPKAFIPIHLFNILHVGVGRASGSVPFNLNSINNCMIRWGEILEINNKKNKLKISLNSLVSSSISHFSESGIYSFSKKIETHTYNPKFTPNLKINDTIAVHWKAVPKKLTAKETKNLRHWTEVLIKLI